MDFKALSLLRPSPKLFRSWSVIRLPLLTSQSIHLTKLITRWDWWIVRHWVFWELHGGFFALDLLFFRTCSQVIKLILPESLTRQSWGWWTARYRVFWDLHWGCLDLHLRFLGIYEQVTHSFYKTHLLSKIEVDRLQDIEAFETFTEVVQTLICDVPAAVRNSTN